MGFKAQREKVGLTQLQVAQFLGIKQSAVCQWETGKTLPRAGCIAALAELYDCRVEDLLADNHYERKNTH